MSSRASFLSWMSLLIACGVLSWGCDRAPTARVPHGSTHTAIVFREVAQASGIDFRHRAGGAREYFFPAIMSAGCAFLDYDCDGDLDILLVDSGDMPPRAASKGTEKKQKATIPSCRLFQQQAPFQFRDVTAEACLSHVDYGVGIAVGDANNDGYPDLYFTNYGRDRLYLNQRDGQFRDVTDESGIENLRWGTSAAFVDYDRDGWLDLFVVNYVDYDPGQPCRINSGQQDFCNPAVFRGSAAKLFHNVSARSLKEPNGPTEKVLFEDASLSSGIALKTAAGLGVVSADFNHDHWPDIYVANDGNPNFLWINQRDGTFQDEGILVGVAYDNLGRPQGSMGIALADVDADQALDLLVTNLDGEYNALYLGSKDGMFRDGSVSAGFLGPSFRFTGFGTALLDIEHDGDADLLVVNGRVRRLAESATAAGSQSGDFWDDYIEPNQIMVNDGAGKFAPVVGTAESAFLGPPAVSRGLAMGDVDNDGDVDVLVSTTAGAARLYRNDTEPAGHWLEVRAIDRRLGGRDMYGAKITLHAGNRQWCGVINPGASYISSHDPRWHVGLGDAATFERMEVVWPDGESETFLGGNADRLVVLERGAGTAQ